jgi:hypothetical protein
MILTKDKSVLKFSEFGLSMKCLISELKLVMDSVKQIKAFGFCEIYL